MDREIIIQTIFIVIVLVIIFTPVMYLGYKISKMLENPYGDDE